MCENEIRVLKCEVKRLAEDGRSRNASISALAGPARREARDVKRKVGEAAREYLLAYALMQGVPYSSLERTTRTSRAGMRVLLDRVSAIVRRHGSPGSPSADEWAVSP